VKGEDEPRIRQSKVVYSKTARVSFWFAHEMLAGVAGHEMMDAGLGASFNKPE
jgi:hypothetical protein